MDELLKYKIAITQIHGISKYSCKKFNCIR